LYSYVGQNPTTFIDPTGLIVTDLTGSAAVAGLANTPLYRSLAGDPNVHVIITNGSLSPETLGITTGNARVVNIAIDPAKNYNLGELTNTVMHELIHADQLRSGNFSYTDPMRRNFGQAEDEAYEYANRYFPSRPVCPK
jgi:hypothetical protein